MLHSIDPPYSRGLSKWSIAKVISSPYSQSEAREQGQLQIWTLSVLVYFRSGRIFHFSCSLISENFRYLYTVQSKKLKHSKEGPIVQGMDNAMYRINHDHNPVDSTVSFIWLGALR